MRVVVVVRDEGCSGGDGDGYGDEDDDDNIVWGLHKPTKAEDDQQKLNFNPTKSSQQPQPDSFQCSLSTLYTLEQLTSNLSSPFMTLLHHISHTYTIDPRRSIRKFSFA
ncbi:hypothetical protein QVD17_35482 [Tagetes erecta]|uniref:Uncharacterized protein n=1 Tax=Tagetes erecta TaxID=13708 RepID=A0AAD8JZK4_TARER|nr:hypothetical protein QVD17_35482 [Tagetes erecta]